MLIRSYQESDQSSVIALWERCDLLRSWNDPEKDIRRKLTIQGEWFLVGTIEENMVATVMVGYDGHRGWVNYLAVDPDHRQLGLGREMMEHAELVLKQAGCPKLNLQLRSANTEALKFYQNIGYNVDDVISLGKRLENDE